MDRNCLDELVLGMMLLPHVQVGILETQSFILVRK